MSRTADADVISALNEVLTAELTAINQYFVHAKMLQDWGYDTLAGKVRAESIDEMKHADELIERILYLGGVPNVQRYWKINIGESVQEQFEVDLQLEYEALPRLNHAIALCRDREDNGTRALLERILISEEEHTDWLETQLSMIGQMGIQNYLSTQAR